MPAPGDLITLEKWNENGQLVVSYPGWLVHDRDPILILARWRTPDLTTPYVTFAQGDLLLEVYYRQRPYSIFTLYDGRQILHRDWGEFLFRAGEDARAQLCRQLSDGAIKGHYINFTRPIRFDPDARRLAWFDLALDIWLPARGQPLLLDEEDFRALALEVRDPDLAQAVERAKDAWLSGRVRYQPCPH
ncbi:MAG TPA: DUF402 domain-containing protein [Caldilineae bacterium]|nr:DUF402 domain-containing protein [Caldilineae bacterium]